MSACMHVCARACRRPQLLSWTLRPSPEQPSVTHTSCICTHLRRETRPAPVRQGGSEIGEEGVEVGEDEVRQ